MDARFKFVLFDEMMKAGIMPTENWHHDMNRLMGALSPDEQRRLRRKFRKLWRKALKAEIRALETKENATLYAEKTLWSFRNRKLTKFGGNLAPDQRPSRQQRQARKEAVFVEMTNTAKKRVKDMTGPDETSDG